VSFNPLLPYYICLLIPSPTKTGLFIPSLVSTIVSVFFLEKLIPIEEEVPDMGNEVVELAPRGQLVFATGILGLLSVPVFKAVTGLPPYLGMLAALGTYCVLYTVYYTL
jgi:hypothetical protein